MTRAITQVDELLRQFDEESGHDFLDRVARSYPAEPSLLVHLLAVAESSEPPRQMAATALLKRYLAAGAVLPAKEVGRLLDLLPALARWEAQLQVLQMLPELQIPKACADTLADCLRAFISSRNKLIRAWAYGGLHRLASLHPEYAPEVRPLLEEIARTGPAAVRARLRQLPPLRAKS